MPIEITIELSEDDIQHFVELARESAAVVASAEDASKFAAATRERLERARAGDPPQFIRTRLDQLQQMVDMIDDEDWQLPQDDLERVGSAIAYFSNPNDLISDRIPGIGFLDDAIMVELVVREMDNELDAYSEFCAYRTAEEQRRITEGLATHVDREDWLADKRATLHSRMRERRRTRDASGSWKIRLW